MSIGMLKSKSAMLNPIAVSLRKAINTKKDSQSFFRPILERRFYHYRWFKNFLKYNMEVEGLELVCDGDTGEIGLGYSFIYINAVSRYKEMIPLFSKTYNFAFIT